MIAIVDYGVGNLFSIRRSLEYLGIDAVITGDEGTILDASHIILPGVGAFGDAVRKLRESGLDNVVISEAKNRKPVLGICLGMQLLFTRGYEFGEHIGLGLIPGEVYPLEADLRAADFDYKVPQIGWNALQIRPDRRSCPLLKYSEDGDAVYYVHSYYAKFCDEFVAAASEYGVSVPGLVWNDNVFGAQFHPEKSGERGLAMLRAFSEVV